MKTLIKYTVIFFAALASSVAANAQDLVILHTNDVHNQLTPQVTGKGKGLGGYERREAYIKEVIKKHGKENVLLLDAGDFSMGSTLFTIYKGDVGIELFNVMEYDAVCVGNHELDRGQEELAYRFSKAKFDVLCANFDFSASPLKDFVKPYTIVEKGGKKIAIIGLMLNMRSFSSSKSIRDITYINATEVLNNLAKELKKEQKCDLVIALSHCGLYTGREGNPSDEQIAPLTEHVDIIVGGHSHTYMEEMLTVKNKVGKDVLIVQDGAMGEYIGRLDLYW